MVMNHLFMIITNFLLIVFGVIDVWIGIPKLILVTQENFK